MNPLQAASEAEYGAGNYIPPVRTTYWSMRIMAYAGSLVFLVLAVAAFFYRRRTLATKPLVPVGRRRDDPVAVHRGARRAGCSPRSAASRGSCSAC